MAHWLEVSNALCDTFLPEVTRFPATSEMLADLCLKPAEYEFFTFRAPTSQQSADERNSSATATFLKNNPVNALPSLEEGMFGYSLTRPTHNQDWYYDIFKTCSNFRCDIEGWHTESGPGVYEAALEYGEIRQMADRAALFKLAVKNTSSKYGITPCFMAKPREGLPGNSGHMHVSLKDNKTGKNLFYRETEDPNPPYADVAHVSDIGRHFLAGVLDGLPDIMPLVAPTVNSYKRLVENFWAPVTVSWGLEHRAASIRLIAPPTCPPKGTRLEVRVPGADTNGYLVLSAILALGWRGIEKRLEIPVPPLGKGQDVGGTADKGQRLAKSLKDATATFARKDSVAREVFGDEFVDHYAGTREHEVRLWDEAVTDWYVPVVPSGCPQTDQLQGSKKVYGNCVIEAAQPWKLVIMHYASCTYLSVKQISCESIQVHIKASEK